MRNRRLGPPLFIATALAIAVIFLLIVQSRRADRGGAAQEAVSPTVASLTPGGTDVLIGIGAAKHLVGVCDQDDDRQGTRGLPRVGDFDHVDWEKLAALHPQILITQFGDRMPPGTQERCAQMNIRIINVRLVVLDDVYREAGILGEAVHEQANEKSALAALKDRLNAVAMSVKGLPRVRAAIADHSDGSVNLIGPPSFHDELLALAGGQNVITNKSYVSVDQERLGDLAPDVVLEMDPTPPTQPQQLLQNDRFWASMPDLPAVKNHRICRVTEPYCMRPGWHVAELAKVFADDLHGVGH